MKSATISISKILTVIEGSIVTNDKPSNFCNVIKQFNTITLNGLMTRQKFNKYKNILLKNGFKLVKIHWFYNAGFTDKNVYNYRIEFNSINTNQFDTLEHHLLIANTSNVYQKFFNGMILYKGCEVLAISTKLNGLPEFGEVLNYEIKEGKTIITVEFCGDNGLWIEDVDVKECKTLDKTRLF